MLRIATDLQDTRWLAYILEEFSRFNRTWFPIEITPLAAAKSFSDPVIIYANGPSKGVCVPNRSSVSSNGQTLKLSEELFVLKGTVVRDNRFSHSVDLFWNAFVFLSRMEEYLSEKRGKKIRSCSFNHPREDKSTFDIPVVNHLFNELEKLIKKNFPNIPFGQKQQPIIEYSHDVDYIRKTLQLRLKQTVFNGFNMFKSIFKPVLFSKQIRKTISFFISNPFYLCFDYWEELEKKANIRSVFYVYAKTGKKNLKSWLLDPSYDITTNMNLQKKLQHLIHEGFEVGLHGSFYSATDEEKLSKEKTTLENAIGTDVQKVRQHWLRYEESKTPYIHNNFFRYDSTLGWNDCMGFRSGIAGRYRPYDHNNQKPFDYMVTPQVIMDANIYDYGADHSKALSIKAIELLEGLRQFKSAHISISWHQRVCNNDYRWHGLYEKILFQEEQEVMPGK